ncbi:hypothetical protein B0T17DRAFT_646176 [Bombardia bombarda]|uniref:Glucose-methanol-choline oxidoreductase N-terminal domain-containing protein n=1 Tax=Bombardia bombarda TaxID=252184 RepID=A0AA39WGF2_9PEZI|nr:hypothetical protein B0T17DRAFT_646176 [Bombardia bombarda]
MQAIATKRKTSELLDSYDFVIAGGGTSGLTVADRLTKAFPNKATCLPIPRAETVLVVEYGDVEYAPGVFDPPHVVWGEQPGGLASSWQLHSTPSPMLNNNTAFVIVGQVVGGSSAINGMFFDRGSRFDYDTVTFTPPSDVVASRYNYTWDASVFGNESTPTRPNYHLLVKHQVTRVSYPGGNPKRGPPVVEVRSLENNSTSNVAVKAETILSAGVFGSPAILQRSGRHWAGVFSAKTRHRYIPVILDLPGVGSNLHDHSGPRLEWNSLGDTVEALYLPPEYGSDPSLIAGYRDQLQALADLLANPRAPSIESAFATGTRE